jgi:hypothetical protein
LSKYTLLYLFILLQATLRDVRPIVKSPTSCIRFFIVSINICMLKEFSKIDSTVFFVNIPLCFRGFLGHMIIYMGFLFCWRFYHVGCSYLYSPYLAKLNKTSLSKKLKSEYTIICWELLLSYNEFSRTPYIFSILSFCYLSSRHHKNKKLYLTHPTILYLSIRLSSIFK